MRGYSESTRWVSPFLRLSLGVGFLSAVADRFGLWGPPGATNVAWGDFASFSAYTAQLNPWAPSALLPLISWGATVMEATLGVALLVGFRIRWTGVLSGLLLLSFAAGMTIGTGVKTAFDASVPAAAGAAFALALLGPGPFSVGGAWRDTCAQSTAAV